MEYGLIGEKLGHSFSPRIHRALAGYDYQLCELAPEMLGGFLAARNFKGLNVTIPYKKAVIPYCDGISETARRIGSVNTLTVLPDGRLWGDNTDYDGFCYTVRAGGIDFSGKKVLLLGSGGTSLTAKAAAEDLGARTVVTVSRSGPVHYGNVAALHADADILVNTTPVGMYPNNGHTPIPLSRFPFLSGVVDVIYNPRYTALLLEARSCGIPSAGGLPMLVAQARAAAERFSGQTIADEAVRRLCGELAAEVTNIVLIGMPGCGKSTVGRIVARLTGRPLVDIDGQIEARAGMSIPDLFARFGEKRFRELEAQTLADEGRVGGRVIATGGGAVLREENYPSLKQNGRIYHLNRARELLACGGRPLSRSPEAVAEMERTRAPLYRRFRDVTTDNSQPPEAAAEQIVEEFYEHFGR